MMLLWRCWESSSREWRAWRPCGASGLSTTANACWRAAASTTALPCAPNALLLFSLGLLGTLMLHMLEVSRVI